MTARILLEVGHFVAQEVCLSRSVFDGFSRRIRSTSLRLVRTIAAGF